jgi:hypothetical protein
MASKKKARSESTKDRHVSGWMVRLSSELKEGIRQVAEKHRRTLTTEVNIAVEEYLKVHGLWPLPEPQGEGRKS